MNRKPGRATSPFSLAAQRGKTDESGPALARQAAGRWGSRASLRYADARERPPPEAPPSREPEPAELSFRAQSANTPSRVVAR